MLTPVLVCAGTTSFALLVLERCAPQLGLVEKPGGHRTHKTPTPVVGGIGMALGLLVTWWLFHDRFFPGIEIVTGAFALALVGLVDDRNGMPARWKMALQASIAGLALALDGGLLFSLGELLPAIDVRLVTAVALPFSVFAVLGVINGVNMLDGLDGLAGKVVLVALGWFSLCAWLVGDPSTMVGNLAIAGVVGAFLLFNERFPGRRRARLFMGDAGSMLLGFLLAWVAIETTQRPDGIPPVIALWICAVPILDTIAVMVKRFRRRRPLMTAGRDHLHHLLRGRGMSVAGTALVVASIGAISGLVGVAGWLYEVPEWMMFVLFLVFSAAYVHVFLSAWIELRALQAIEVPPVQLTDLPL